MENLSFRFKDIKHIHLVGIGGAGMSGIAELLIDLGYQISGSDQCANQVTKRLQKKGAIIYQGHDAKQVEGIHLLVYSNAVPLDNIEICKAKKQGIICVPRVHMLAKLMSFSKGITVLGAHGKTTTTGLIIEILTHAGLDPSWVVGGYMHAFKSHGKLGAGSYFIAEADESEQSFLLLGPEITVLTNIDNEHLEAYDDEANMFEVLLQFLKQLPFHGLAVVCLDDPKIEAMIPDIKSQVFTYGFHPKSDIRVIDFKHQGLHTFCRLFNAKSQKEMTLTLNLPGKYNLQNALAALAVGMACDIPEESIKKSLKNFSGVARRFQHLGDFLVKGKVLTLIDDYGHHPAEIRAVTTTLRQIWPHRQLLLFFQPHRYTRTQRLFDDFVEVFLGVDQLFLFPIYPASEAPIEGVTSQSLIDSIAKKSSTSPILVKNFDEANQLLYSCLHEDALILVQGAGTVTDLTKNWMQIWQPIPKKMIN